MNFSGVHFSVEDRVAIFGNQPKAIQTMLDYDFICGKADHSLVCIVDPHLTVRRTEARYFFGAAEISITVCKELIDCEDMGPTILVNFASSRSAFAVAMEALQLTTVRMVVIFAEGVPEREAQLLRHSANSVGKIILGPSSVGAISAGILKIGNAGGNMENILATGLYYRGSVGIVSKSGGMLNELMTMTCRQTDGIAEAVSIGGDRYPITRLVEQVMKYEDNPSCKLIVLLGELGGLQEQEVAEALLQKKITKPLVAWVSGTGSLMLPTSIQFGHAGAMAVSKAESAQAKNAALRAAGAHVPDSFEGLELAIGKTAETLGLKPISMPKPKRQLPQGLGEALSNGSVRHVKGIITSIALTEEGKATYVGKNIAYVAEHESIGYVLGLLWFKREFPQNINELFEMVIKLTADHGAAVSGAHATIVTARAGRDLVSGLAAGLLTVGPRFGGAVNESAALFRAAIDDNITAFDLVADMRAKGLRIPGIGHRVHSFANPDPRVSMLIKHVETLDIPHRYLTFAKQVESITLLKKDSLILNVDGAIAAILLDVLSKYLDDDDVDDLIACEALNAFFVLGRSIGLIGHFIDQKRLRQPLYRHPEWDISEVS